MFEPIRGGTRGGQAEFKWTDVSADKDRENYLGHSINAPTGRWQKNKDVHWYGRDVKMEESERVEEIRKVKEAEADALAVALGFAPAKKADSSAAVSSAPAAGSSSPQALKVEPAEERRLEKEGKRKRKEEKRARKERRRLERAERREGSERSRRRTEDRSRSRSPRRSRLDDNDHHERSPRYSRRRSWSPTSRERQTRGSHDYDASDWAKERERDRRRRDVTSKARDQGGARWRRD